MQCISIHISKFALSCIRAVIPLTAVRSSTKRRQGNKNSKETMWKMDLAV